MIALFGKKKEKKGRWDKVEDSFDTMFEFEEEMKKAGGC